MEKIDDMDEIAHQFERLDVKSVEINNDNNSLSITFGENKYHNYFLRTISKIINEIGKEFWDSMIAVRTQMRSVEEMKNIKEILKETNSAPLNLPHSETVMLVKRNFKDKDGIYTESMNEMIKDRITYFLTNIDDISRKLKENEQKRKDRGN